MYHHEPHDVISNDVAGPYHPVRHACVYTCDACKKWYNQASPAPLPFHALRSAPRQPDACDSARLSMAKDNFPLALPLTMRSPIATLYALHIAPQITITVAVLAGIRQETVQGRGTKVSLFFGL